MRKWSSWSLLLVFIIGITGGAVGCAKLTKEGAITDPTALTEGLSPGLTTNAGVNIASNNAVLPAAGDIDQPKDSQQQVIDDFKENMMGMFRAWRAADINEFRSILALGFSGDLLEAKVKEAEECIGESEGAEVNPVNFTQVKLVKLEENKAIVEAEINYSGYEYNNAKHTRGEAFSPVTLYNQYTLESKNNHWYINGETPPNGNNQ
jgi:hypothetical protein